MNTWRSTARVYSMGHAFAAPVAELADALDLGSSALWRESSSLSGRTKFCGGSGGDTEKLRDSRVLDSLFCSSKVSPARGGDPRLPMLRTG